MLSKSYWERRAERLFKEWDDIHDPYGLPLPEFLKAVRKVDEASLIIQVLNACEREKK